MCGFDLLLQLGRLVVEAIIFFNSDAALLCLLDVLRYDPPLVHLLGER